MSTKRTGRTAKGLSSVAEDQQTGNVFVGETAPNWWSGLSRNSKWLVFGLIAFLSIGVFGAGCKSLEEDARDQNRIAQEDRPLLSKVPIPLPPTPLPRTPQLSKEYIYAGSRLLSVEDANANAAPPADLAIWRPSTGTWWVMGGQGSQQAVQSWGTNGDIPVPGDYDGDGKTDYSVFRPSTNTWYFVNSSTGATRGYAFGAPGDKVAQADYDGDGKTDTAIFRPSTGYWYILRSSDSGVTQQQFGLSTDTPAPADYDGDGKADIGVWRNSDQTSYSLNSGNNAFQQHYLGQSGERVVSADYDGDGKADYAIYNSTTATWHIRQSTNSQITTTRWENPATRKSPTTTTATARSISPPGAIQTATGTSANRPAATRSARCNGDYPATSPPLHFIEGEPVESPTSNVLFWNE